MVMMPESAAPILSDIYFFGNFWARVLPQNRVDVLPSFPANLPLRPLKECCIEMKTFVLFLAAVVLISPKVFAKCGFRGGVRHCEEFQVGIQLPAITKPEIREKFWSGDFCECWLNSGTTTIKVIFNTPGKCPSVGSKVMGNVYPLCQDTGRWTDAEAVFEPKAKSECNKSHEAAFREAAKRAEKIKKGMSKSEVENIFRELDHVEWQKKSAVYYEHPQVLIDIPYDEKYETVVGPARVFEGNSGGTFANWSPFKRQ
jgi:hypothetical protein